MVMKLVACIDGPQGGPSGSGEEGQEKQVRRPIDGPTTSGHVPGNHDVAQPLRESFRNDTPQHNCAFHLFS